MSYPYDRRFFRLRYPIGGAPRFVTSGLTHSLVDIGEGGFRYAPGDASPPEVGSVVSGVIEFAEGEPLELEGIVVRVQGGEVAVHCAKRAIPLAVVLREQRYVRKHFPFRDST
jgi:hypothetical protein